MHPTNTAAAQLASSAPPTPSAYPPHGDYMQIDSGPYYQNEYPGYHGNGHSYNQPYHHGGHYQHTHSSMHHHYPHSDDYPGHSSQGGGQFTRNLIGSLTASAFRLKDDKDVLGIWFILQDLSVRTEGLFRLRFSFLNLGMYRPPPLIFPTQPKSPSNFTRNSLFYPNVWLMIAPLQREITVV